MGGPSEELRRRHGPVAEEEEAEDFSIWDVDEDAMEEAADVEGARVKRIPEVSARLL